MDYDRKTKEILNIYKEKIENEKIKQINLLNEKKILENSFYETDLELDKIKKNKKQLSTSKGNITKFKKKISKIAGPIFIKTCPYGPLDIIINNIDFNKNNDYKGKRFRTNFNSDDEFYIFYKNIIFNKLAATCTIFETYFKENYKIIQFGCHVYNKNYSIYIKNNIFHNVEIEQLLYMPLSYEGRSFIHLLVRHNKLDILKKLVEKFPNLNINNGTTKENWTPFHNATWFNYDELVVFLSKHGINNKLIVEIKEKKFTIIDWFHLMLKRHKNNFNKELYNNTIQFNMMDNFNKYKKQTIPEFNSLLENDSLLEFLKNIYIYLDKNMKMIRGFNII